MDETEGLERTIHFARWFIGMRWIACLVSLLLILLTIQVFHYLNEGAFWWLVVLVTLLAFTNVVYHDLLRRGGLLPHILEIQIYADLFILTGLLHCSGGIENPLAFAYLFHIIIAGILLDKRRCYVIVGIASALFTLLALVEMLEFLPHRTLLVFPHLEEQGVLEHAAYRPIYVVSRIGLQFLLLMLTAYFTTTIMTRLRAEERRALSDRQRLERVLQATGAGLLILDAERHLAWYNQQARTWFPLSQDRLGQRLPELGSWLGKVSEDDFDTLQVTEQKITDTMGQERYLQITLAPLTDAQARVYQIVALVQDITERKLLEAEMMHSGKMAVLGLMAAGIAHEVGNPLASITTRLQLLKEEHDETFLQQSLQLLQREIGRITRIVHGVSQLARPAKQEWGTCSIQPILDELLNILRLHKQAKRCEIQTEFASELPTTTGVPDQLMQVFLNLGINALEAMPEGGHLTIRAFSSGSDLQIEFEDTGPGMDEQTRANVFEPFFSTKDNGLGLGLSIARNIVHAHGGTIEVESSPGEGTCFRIALPIR